jgi:hypothetical protein
MPESPDFEEIAARVDREFRTLLHSQAPDQSVAFFATHLRDIWNARGAVDVAKIEHELSAMMGATLAGPYVKHLDRALRGLDRT